MRIDSQPIATPKPAKGCPKATQTLVVPNNLDDSIAQIGQK
jgi:hypothetical protein